jgi:hypothetical protein
MPPQLNQQPDTKYAQIVSVFVSKYDATFMFYQVEPKKLGNESSDYMPVQREVARITVPLQSAMELKVVIDQLFRGTQDKKK